MDTMKEWKSGVGKWKRYQENDAYNGRFLNIKQLRVPFYGML